MRKYETSNKKAFLISVLALLVLTTFASAINVKAIPYYTITLDVGANGECVSSPSTLILLYQGQPFTLTAYPDAGYAFKNFTFSNGVTATVVLNPFTIQAYGNWHIDVNFVAVEPTEGNYTIYDDVYNNHGGYITHTPISLTNLPNNTFMQMEAHSYIGHSFVRWYFNGNTSSGNFTVNPFSTNIIQNFNITAFFDDNTNLTRNYVTETCYKNDTAIIGGGYITTETQAGYGGYATSTGEYFYGTVGVSFYARNYTNYEFTKWVVSGDTSDNGNSTNNPFTTNIYGNATVKAYFAYTGDGSIDEMVQESLVPVIELIILFAVVSTVIVSLIALKKGV